MLRGASPDPLPRGEKRGWKPGHLGLGALLAGAGLAIGTLAYAYMATHPPRRRVQTPHGVDEMPLEEVTFLSRDGKRLSGWFSAHPQARGTLIFCHGYPANRMEMLGWARLLWPEGFHTLLFDFRALGESEGDLCSIGYLEVQDLLGAVDFVAARPASSELPIGVYGLSMGGAVAIMAAAQETRLAAVATHGAYATLERAIRQRGRMFLGPLGPVLSTPAIWWGRRWFPEHPCNVSPQDVIGRIAPRPVFLSHGAKDRIVHTGDAHALYEAAQQPKTLRMLPRSLHVRIDREVVPEYQRELIGFFCQNIL